MIKLGASILFLLVVAGCSAKKPEPCPFEELRNAILPVECVLVHPVRYRGETLGLIASWYTGDGENWKQVWEYNAHLNPRTIQIGNHIRIPMRLVRNHQPLPEEAAVRFQRILRGRARTTANPAMELDGAQLEVTPDPSYDKLFREALVEVLVGPETASREESKPHN